MVEMVKSRDANKEVNPAFEKRMMNWRETVRMPSGNRGSAGSCCAGWAAQYVAARNKQEYTLALALEITQPSSPLSRVAVNELDGWLVEAAVRTLVHFDQVQILRYRYVWEYPNHFIKNKLRVQNPRINDSSIRIVLGRAITNLSLVLEKLDSPDKIRAYNLHARSVPRLEA